MVQCILPVVETALCNHLTAIYLYHLKTVLRNTIMLSQVEPSLGRKLPKIFQKSEYSFSFLPVNYIPFTSN